MLLISFGPGSLAVFLLNQEFLHWWPSNTQLTSIKSGEETISATTLLYWSSELAIGLFLTGCCLVLWFRSMRKRSTQA